jgi:uncharacterized protein (TIGR00645 family)
MEKLLFTSRWLQAPLYFGLIVAQLAYVYVFMHELWHLISHITALTEVEVMLIVLGLIDAVMIANLLIMVTIGGYETFVSRLYIDDHPDKPDWLNHVDASILKIKLSLSLITISSVHLLKTFINADNIKLETIMAQIGIHATFVLSAVLLTYADKMMRKDH